MYEKVRNQRLFLFGKWNTSQKLDYTCCHSLLTDLSTPMPGPCQSSLSQPEIKLSAGFPTRLKVNLASWAWPWRFCIYSDSLASLNSISPHSQCSCHSCLLAVPHLPISEHTHLRISSLLFSLPRTSFPKTLAGFLLPTTQGSAQMSPPGWFSLWQHTPSLNTHFIFIFFKALIITYHRIEPQ